MYYCRIKNIIVIFSLSRFNFTSLKRILINTTIYISALNLKIYNWEKNVYVADG